MAESRVGYGPRVLRMTLCKMPSYGLYSTNNISSRFKQSILVKTRFLPFLAVEERAWPKVGLGVVLEFWELH